MAIKTAGEARIPSTVLFVSFPVVSSSATATDGIRTSPSRRLRLPSRSPTMQHMMVVDGQGDSEPISFLSASTVSTLRTCYYTVALRWIKFATWVCSGRFKTMRYKTQGVGMDQNLTRFRGMNINSKFLSHIAMLQISLNPDFQDHLWTWNLHLRSSQGLRVVDVVPSVRNHFLEHRFSWRNRRLPAKFSTATLVDQPLDAWLVGRWQVGDQGKSRAYLKMDRLDFAAAMANDDTQGLPVPSWGAIPLSNWLGNHVLYMENMCMHINTHNSLGYTQLSPSMVCF